MPSVVNCKDMGNVINNVATYRALQAAAHHSPLRCIFMLWSAY